MGMVQIMVVFQIFILLLCSSIHDAIISVQAADLAAINSSCQTLCGDVSIPYPFGIGAGCSVDDWFSVVCNDSSGSPKPVLRRSNLEVLNISVGGTVRVNYGTLSSCISGSNTKENAELIESPFIFSQSENRFIVIGCDNVATMLFLYSFGEVAGGCMSICGNDHEVMNASSCNGINCCEATIPEGLNAFYTIMDNATKGPYPKGGCKSAFLAEEKWFKADYPFSNTSSTMSYVPVVLEWRIFYTSFNSLPIAVNGWTANNSSSNYYCFNDSASVFTCSCKQGFEGNPYLLGGCQDRSSPLSIHSLTA